MTSFILSLAVRLTILLIAGGLVAFAVRRSTYAARHVVLAATLACVLALPATMVLIPEWRVGLLPSWLASEPAPAARTLRMRATVIPEAIHPVLVTSAVSSVDNTAETSGQLSASDVALGLAVTEANVASRDDASRAIAPLSGARAFSLSSLRPTVSQIILAVWLLGVLVGLSWIALGRYVLARVRRHAARLDTPEWRTILNAERALAGVTCPVALLASADVSSPVTWGILSPVIVLPEESLEWTEQRRRVVIMHEMAHIARRDSATQLMATLACVAYWVHPLVLLAARKLRAECERACDERVIELGTPATDYAAHLLDVAKLARSFGAANIVSVAMARPSQLEGRLLAVLGARPKRGRASTARSRALAISMAASAMLVISAFKPVAREAIARAPVAMPTFVSLSRMVDSAPAATAHTARARAVEMPVSVAIAKPAPVQSSTVATAAAPAPFAAAIALPSISRLASAFAVLGAAKSDTTIEKSVSAKSGGTLDLDLDTGGDVEITASSDDKVTVNASLGGRGSVGTALELTAKDGDAKLTTRFDGKPSRNQSFDNSFTISVPKHYNIRVHSAGGHLTINGVDGEFTGTTGGGEVALDHTTGRAELSTGGGDIDVANSHLSGLVSTGAGTVHFNHVTGDITGNSGFGDVIYESSEVPDGAGKSSGGYKSYSYRYRTKSDRDRSLRESTDRTAERAAEMAEKGQDAMEHAQDEMERHRDEMERAREESDRMRVMSDDDDAPEPPPRLITIDADTMFRRARVAMRISQRALDSSMRIMELNRGVMDTVVRVMKKMRMPLERMGKLMIIEKDGGNIELGDALDGAILSTGGGAISIGRASGAVSAHTGGGDIEIASASGAAVANTGAGDVSLTMVGPNANPVDVSSGKGNISLIIPKGANATLDLETAYTRNFGKETKIKSDWPLDVTETKDWDDSRGTPRKYVRVHQKIGKGGPVIRVRTVNGNIELKQAN